MENCNEIDRRMPINSEMNADFKKKFQLFYRRNFEMFAMITFPAFSSFRIEQSRSRSVGMHTKNQ